VRGSKFGIEVKPAGGKPMSARPILLADASDGGFIYLAAVQKEETGTVTVVHSFEGQVEVKSKIDDTIQFLLPGKSIEATIRGLSKIFDTPAKAVEQFINSVEIKRQKAAKELEKKTEVVDKKMDDAGKKMEEKMEKDKPFGFMEKWGRDLEDKFKSNK
jgi:DNA/RNA endonuclease YhcR with UshA esterase domain